MNFVAQCYLTTNCPELKSVIRSVKSKESHLPPNLACKFKTRADIRNSTRFWYTMLLKLTEETKNLLWSPFSPLPPRRNLPITYFSPFLAHSSNRGLALSSASGVLAKLRCFSAVFWLLSLLHSVILACVKRGDIQCFAISFELRFSFRWENIMKWWNSCIIMIN